mgnify:CR=1 FL=1|jgi:uncharacterized membrane protein
MLFRKRFLRKLDEEQIINSIKKAENMTSGEIRVHVQYKLKGELMAETARVFHELEMDQTENRNGVLILIVPSKKVFSILGDKGINDKVPDNFWEDIKKDLELHFKANKISEGLSKNIEKIGEKLKEHFPFQQNDENELPDSISFA